MNKKIDIGVHWYNRPLKLHYSAEQIVHFLKKLSLLNEAAFSIWYLKGRTRKDALRYRVPFEVNYFIEKLGNKDMENKPPEICYTISLWNGADDESNTMTISFTLGSNEKIYFTNNCVLTIPEKFYNESIKDLMCSFWNPEFVKIDQDEYRL
jgi:hypothetical protein